MGEQLLKADDLLFGLVSAVIDDKIKERHFPPKLAPEISIGLIADKHFDQVVLVGLACWFDVNAINVSFGAKIVAPHFKAAAAVNANFKHVGFATSETAEVSMVDVKIVIPLPNAATLPMAVEEIAQRVCSVGNLLCGVQSRPTPIAPVTANRGGGGEKSSAYSRPDRAQAKPGSVKHRNLLS
jgi:hypothetical protein